MTEGVVCEDYASLIERNGCGVTEPAETGRFALCVEPYLRMVAMQLTDDARKLLGFDEEAIETTMGNSAFLQGLAHAGKVAQARFVARRE